MKDRPEFDQHVQEWLTSRAPADAPVALSIIVPAYNEERRLPPTIVEAVDYFDSRGIEYELVVVDDGSRDGTSEMVRRFERLTPRVRLIRVPDNHGKGHAVRTGILSARGAEMLIMDADGATPIAEFERLKAALTGEIEVVIGSRAIFGEDTNVKTVWYRKFMGRTFNWFVNRLAVPDVKDSQCGFKLFSARAARFLFEHQTLDGWSFDVEILYLARRAEIRTAEIPVNWTNIPGSKVRLVSDSLRMLRDIAILRYRHRGVTPETYRKRPAPG